MTPPTEDAAFARWLAERTGERLLALRAEQGFADPAALRKLGDRQAHDLLVTALQEHRPGDAVLSEEGVRDDPGRLVAERVWIIDPLDGTREFGEPDRTDWAVHVALWQRGSGLVAGAVGLPARHLVLTTDRLPGRSVRAGGAGAIRLMVSRSRAPALVAAVAERVGAVLVPLGSAGAKIASVVTGEADAYLHAGGQYEWDSAAPVAVARATGLHTSRIDGSTLEYNQADPHLPDLLVCRRDLAVPLLTAIQECR